MLKSTTRILQAKSVIIQNAQKKANKINEAVGLFLKNQEYSEQTMAKVHTSYNFKDDTLYLETDSKLIASELSLRLSGLNMFLKQAKLTLRQIVIR